MATYLGGIVDATMVPVTGRFGARYISSDLKNPDFVDFAKSFGVAPYRAETPAALQSALETAIANDVPALIHVPCGEMPSPWDMILMPRIRG